MKKAPEKQILSLPATTLLLVLASTPAMAMTWTVCPSGCDFTTIQGAITGATPGDVIEVQGGDHTENDITINKSVEIRSASGQSVTLRAAASRGTAPARVIKVNPGVFVTIRNLWIRFGNDSNGGAILNSGQLLLDRVRLLENDASSEGGAIYNDVAANLVIRNSVMVRNQAGLHGGGISNRGHLTIESSNVAENSAVTNGGGIHSLAGDIELRHALITGNDAHSGGGVSTSGGNLSISNSFLKLNEAMGGVGGGLRLDSGTQSVSVTQTSIYGNTAFTGGGIYSRTAQAVRLHGVSVISNFATNHGGGIYLFGEKRLYLQWSTVYLNFANTDNSTAGQGGGIHIGTECNSQTCLGAVAWIKNSLIAGNVDFTDPNSKDCLGILTSDGYNLVGEGSTGSIGPCRIQGNLTGTIVNTPAGLGTTMDHGGPSTWDGVIPVTVDLLPGSPAIDAGDPAGCADGIGAPRAYDQRYAPHVGTCDIGAFEFDSVPFPPAPLFGDGFESGGTHFWSTTSP